MARYSDVYMLVQQPDLLSQVARLLMLTANL